MGVVGMRRLKVELRREIDELAMNVARKRHMMYIPV